MCLRLTDLVLHAPRRRRRRQRGGTRRQPARRRRARPLARRRAQVPRGAVRVKKCGAPWLESATTHGAQGHAHWEIAWRIQWNSERSLDLKHGLSICHDSEKRIFNGPPNLQNHTTHKTCIMDTWLQA